MRLKLSLKLALGALLLVTIHSVDGIDFGVGKIADTFSSGVATAAKIPISAASAIASFPETVSNFTAAGDGVGNETSWSPVSSSTSTTPTSTYSSSTTRRTTRGSTRGTTVMTMITSKMTSTTPAANQGTRESQQGSEEAATDATTTDSTNATGSWLPEAIKSPINAVAAIPSAVAQTAGGAWQTVSETVVNQDPEHNVKFYFYDDPKNLTKYKQIVIGQPDTLRSIRVAKNSRIKILIHGFMQDYNSSFPQNLKDTILLHMGSPVVTVDWGHMAEGKFGPDALKTLLYPFIVDNVATVGEYVGDFVIFLKNNSVISSYDQVHIIGFSLGGHVSGIAGWTVQNRTSDGSKVGRITGLDPAGPKFFLKTQERKLNQDDANLVDIIHTSHLGYFIRLGHIDFFPNGGKIQPGCVETDEGIPEAVASLGSLLTGSCSHARAHEYYLQSIKDHDLYGCECNNIFKYELTGCEVDCEDKVPFGEQTPSQARGAYFLSI